MKMSEEFCRKDSETLRKLLSNPEWRSQYIEKSLKNAQKTPNKPEAALLELINEYKLPFKYVGDGQFILGGRCPDFINTNGKKQVIELFGVHWHPIFDVADRTENYRRFGFETMVIWEDELKDKNKLIKKLTHF